MTWKARTLINWDALILMTYKS